MSRESPVPPTGPAAATNLKDDVSGAAWTYLLDSLELEDALCVGTPPSAGVRTLQRIASRLSIVDEVPHNLRRGSLDLIYVTVPKAPLLDEPAARNGLLHCLTPRGRLVVERQSVARGLANAGSHSEQFWVTPAKGEVRSAVPMDERLVRDFFVRAGIAVPSMPRPLRLIDRIAPLAASRRRTIVVAAPPPREDAPVSAGAAARSAVPAYLQNIARADGVELGAHRYGLSARGRYSSRKVVFYLFAEHARKPELVIKTTRDPVHNGRLANEERALRHVGAESLAPPGTFPAVRFAGEHGGLRVVGEEAIDGELLSRRASRRDAVGAYSWLTELAARSARRGDLEARLLMSKMQDTVRALEEAYVLDQPGLRRLRDAAALLGDVAERLPVVMMHGDPTSGNAVRRTDGRIAFLDWESATVDGVPLWDLFHFARSHRLDIAPLRRVARQPRRLVDGLRRDSTLREALDLYVERLSIPSAAVSPLFITGWAHRAVKEVSRLPANRLDRGHYIGLVRAALERPL